MPAHSPSQSDTWHSSSDFLLIYTLLHWTVTPLVSGTSKKSKDQITQGLHIYDLLDYPLPFGVVVAVIKFKNL